MRGNAKGTFIFELFLMSLAIQPGYENSDHKQRVGESTPNVECNDRACSLVIARGRFVTRLGPVVERTRLLDCENWI